MKYTLLSNYKQPDESDLSCSTDTLASYVISVYSKDGEQKDTISIIDRKLFAIKKYGISKGDAEKLLKNNSISAAYMISSFFKIYNERQFELYVSALEAATILLDVVRRPINDFLEDEKWLSALKAKKQGFSDAKELINEANAIAESMTGSKNSDIEDAVNKSAFNVGLAEKLALGTKPDKSSKKS